jgi:hypothetical protein
LGEARRELDDVGSLESVFAGEVVESVKLRCRRALGDEAFEAAYSHGLEGDDGAEHRDRDRDQASSHASRSRGAGVSAHLYSRTI